MLCLSVEDNLFSLGSFVILISVKVKDLEVIEGSVKVKDFEVILGAT